jgi:hypothetical protein
VTREKIEGKWNKEMEKRNFIRWYRNANHEEIEKVNGEGKRILERLLIEYTDEIEMINKSKYQINLNPSQKKKCNNLTFTFHSRLKQQILLELNTPNRNNGINLEILYKYRCQTFFPQCFTNL